jgi:hypothetical protein
MVILCTLFDQMVKTKLTHGGKGFTFPMLNVTISSLGIKCFYYYAHLIADMVAFVALPE